MYSSEQHPVSSSLVRANKLEQISLACICLLQFWFELSFRFFLAHDDDDICFTLVLHGIFNFPLVTFQWNCQAELQVKFLMFLKRLHGFSISESCRDDSRARFGQKPLNLFFITLLLYISLENCLQRLEHYMRLISEEL